MVDVLSIHSSMRRKSPRCRSSTTSVTRMLILFPLLCIAKAEMRGVFRREWMVADPRELTYRLHKQTQNVEEPTFEIARQLRAKSTSGDGVSIGIAGSMGSKSKKSSKKSGKSHNVFSSGKGKGGKGGSSDYEWIDVPDSGDDHNKQPSSPSGPGGPNSPSGPNSPTLSPWFPAPTPDEPSETPPSDLKEPPTLPPGQNNGNPALPPSGIPRCNLNSDGLFGSMVGISEETEFAYQATVIPSVTKDELDLDILPKAQDSMGVGILGRLFPQCVGDAVTQQTSKDVQVQRQRPGANRPWGRHLRFLQQELEGFTVNPRDLVVEGLTCANVEPIFPCFVIRGLVTSYTQEKMDAATKQRVLNTIQEEIETGNLIAVDNRLLDITWRDINEFPIENTGGGDGGGGGSGGQGNGNGGSDTGGSGNGDNNGGSFNGRPPPDDNIDRAVGGNEGLETWSIALIAVGGAITLCMAYLCLRRPSAEPVYDDDDEDSSNSSSGSSSSSEESTKENEKQPFVAPMPIYRSAAKPDEQGEPLRSSPRAEGFADEPKSVGSSIGSPIEEASESGSSSYSEGSDGEPEREQSPVTLELEDDQRDEPSAIDMADFSQPSKKTSEVHESSDFTSEYSSYEEEVDEEYEIEYVEEEDGLVGVDEESEGQEETFWDEDGSSDGTPEKIMPWHAQPNTQTFG